MKETNEQYRSPEIQVMLVESEKGFCGSLLNEYYQENDYGYDWSGMN